MSDPVIKDVCEREVEWCLKNGYSHRIKLDNTGKQFVIGDWGWNLGGTRNPEYIEPAMHRDGVYKETI